ncbi:MAG: hypothetical protein R3Y50_07090 [Rikenellaceae bacterium]
METERYFYIHRNKTKVPLLAVDGKRWFDLDSKTPIDSATERMLAYYIYDARDIGKAAKLIVDLTKSQAPEQTNKILSDFKQAHPVTKTSDNEVNLVPFCSSLESGMKLFVSNCSHFITRDDEIKLLDIVFEAKSKGAENALTKWFDRYREENGVNFDLHPHINQSRELAKSFLQQHGVFYDKRTSALGFDRKLTEVKPDEIDLIVKAVVKREKMFNTTQKWIEGLAVFGGGMFCYLKHFL